uniref:Uncharacterized protein n=1 Tax=Anguilla anguilla TaxID=7936 RepID=A0A0E9PIE9_ANGAN
MGRFHATLMSDLRQPQWKTLLWLLSSQHMNACQACSGQKPYGLVWRSSERLVLPSVIMRWTPVSIRNSFTTRRPK